MTCILIDIGSCCFTGNGGTFLCLWVAWYFFVYWIENVILNTMKTHFQILH